MTEQHPRENEDLTARARIRDAALQLFAENDMSRVTIREIAQAAGVSPGLVQHYYGSKETLRRACDEYVVETLKRTKQESLHGGMSNPVFMLSALDTSLPLQRYLARALVSGSPAAAELFDDAVEAGKDLYHRGLPGVMSRPNTSDLHAYATVLTGMSLGLVVMHDHLSRVLGADVLTAEGYPRMARAMLDILADDLLSPELVAQLRTALDWVEAGPPDPMPGARIPTSDAAARKADSDPPA